MPGRFLVEALLGASLPVLCHGHGQMTLPPSRNGGTIDKAADCLQGECMWFSQPDGDVRLKDPTAQIPAEPTLNDALLRTYNIHVAGGPLDYTRAGPWRAPGSAPVLGSGCGRAGGGPVRMKNGGIAKEFGLVQNMDGSELPRIDHKTVWKRGSVQEVAWAINANHGGGYAYRLCRSDGNITESCFQSGHLAFAGDTQWLQTWSNNHSEARRVAIPRVTVSKGTFPVGSQWARNPIPSCRMTGAQAGWPNCKADDCGGCCQDPSKAPLPADPRFNESWWRNHDCKVGCAQGFKPWTETCGGTVQFPEPTPGMSGLWSTWHWCDSPSANDDGRRLHGVSGVSDTSCSSTTLIATNIVDLIQVPATLEPGHYLLSWRWDCEQSHQVWQNCADVEIVGDTIV